MSSLRACCHIPLLLRMLPPSCAYGGCYSPLHAVAAALTAQRTIAAVHSRSFATGKVQAVRNVRGTSDIFGAESSVRMQLVQRFAEVMRSYGYAHGETPLLEQTALFARGLGESSDVVSKEMFSFIPWQVQRSSKDAAASSSEESLTLRPEGTAGLLRAAIQTGALARHAPTLAGQNTHTPPSLPLRTYYHGPMFRYERPQRGRQRQFTQLGMERVGGGSSPAARIAGDIEALASACATLAALLPLSQQAAAPPSQQGPVRPPLRLKVLVNSLGESEGDRQAYAAALREYFTSSPSLSASLSPDSQHRLARGAVLRILDSKAPEDQGILAGAPLITDYLSALSRDSLAQVCNTLATQVLPHTSAGITLHLEPRLVRGLDYYSGLIFEVVADTTTTTIPSPVTPVPQASSEGSPSGSGSGGQVGTVLAGGRYDRLPSMLGYTSASPAPCIGWAAGLERLALFSHYQPETGPDYSSPGLALCPVLDKGEGEAGAAHITAAVTLLGTALRAHAGLQSASVRVVQMEGGVPLKRALPVAASPPWSQDLPLLPGAYAQVALLVGSGEIAAGTVLLRDLRAQTQRAVPVPGLQGWYAGLQGQGGRAPRLDVQALATALLQALRQ